MIRYISLWDHGTSRTLLRSDRIVFRSSLQIIPSLVSTSLVDQLFDSMTPLHRSFRATQAGPPRRLTWSAGPFVSSSSACYPTPAARLLGDMDVPETGSHSVKLSWAPFARFVSLIRHPHPKDFGVILYIRLMSVGSSTVVIFDCTPKGFLSMPISRARGPHFGMTELGGLSRFLQQQLLMVL